MDLTNLEQRVINDLKSRIEVVPDFPKAGVQFLDIFSLLRDTESSCMLYNLMEKLFDPKDYDIIVSPEARGFGLGQVMGRDLKKGFIPARKPGKLPRATIGIDYELEYGTARLEVHEDDLAPGTRVLVVDDLMATGGTARALAKLLTEQFDCEVIGVATLISLDYLERVDFPVSCELRSVIYYDEPPLAGN